MLAQMSLHVNFADIVNVGDFEGESGGQMAVADDGSIKIFGQSDVTLAGKLNAGGQDGGDIEVKAGNDIEVTATADISASGNDVDGKGG